MLHIEKVVAVLNKQFGSPIHVSRYDSTDLAVEIRTWQSRFDQFNLNRYKDGVFELVRVSLNKKSHPVKWMCNDSSVKFYAVIN